jgi:hypothetical protein
MKRNYQFLLDDEHGQGLVMVKTPFILLVKLLTILVFFTSCWHPPFDPEVSASVLSARKLGDPIWEVKVSLPYEARNGYYIPGKLTYSQGFWITKESGSLNISYAFFDQVLNNGGITKLQNIPVSSYVGLQVIPHPNDSTTFFVSLPAIMGWQTMSLSGGFESFLTTADDEKFWGAGAVLTWNGSQEVGTCYIATYANGQVKLIDYDTQSTQATSYYQLPPKMPETFTFAAKNDYGAYLSGYLADGTPVTYYWFEAGGPIQLPMDRAMTGLLTDGRLLAETGDRIYIYEKDGTYEFAIATGSLHFSFERYDTTNSRWVSVFTRTLQIAAPNDDAWDYLISIYEITTADLYKLKL